MVSSYMLLDSFAEIITPDWIFIMIKVAHMKNECVNFLSYLWFSKISPW